MKEEINQFQDQTIIQQNNFQKICWNVKSKKVKINKPVYLGMSILDISKTFMYEFWYDCLKPRYKDKAKLCYMDTDSFVTYIFNEDFFEDINNDVERWLDTSNYDQNDTRPLLIGKNKKVI